MPCSTASPTGPRIWVASETDVFTACRAARLFAERLGFSRVGAYQIATAASELAANMLLHAGCGTLLANALAANMLGANPLAASDHSGDGLGIELIAVDRGPGIADLSLALTDGFSTGQGLGCGLPGVKRLMDEFLIDSVPGLGTCVRTVKWLLPTPCRLEQAQDNHARR
ncbi:MAG: anti-sigma regulatory factor [Halochromatium sp.]|nr:anti-sigma regulatory factor [Halochromatium sp.]